MHWSNEPSGAVAGRVLAPVSGGGPNGRTIGLALLLSAAVAAVIAVIAVVGGSTASDERYRATDCREEPDIVDPEVAVLVCDEMPAALQDSGFDRAIGQRCPGFAMSKLEDIKNIYYGDAPRNGVISGVMTAALGQRFTAFSVTILTDTPKANVTCSSEGSSTVFGIDLETYQTYERFN